MITLNEIQEKFTKELKNCGITQTALAKKLGIKQQNISQYIKGQTFPALDTFANICKLLDLDANEILCINEKEKPSINIQDSFNNNNGKINVKF